MKRRYTKWPERLDGRLKRNRYDAGKAMIHVAARNVEEPNPAPWYSYSVSTLTLVAVYKANVASSNYFRSVGLLDNDWRNMSYATDRGIVFG